MESFLERNLPPYLAQDLAAWKKGVEEKSHLLDCLWGAFVNDTPYLSDLQRQFYKTYLAARYEVMFS